MRKTMTILAAGAVSAWGIGVFAAGPNERDPGRERGGLTFRLATSAATTGFEAVRGERAGSLFVAPKSGLSEADLVSAETIPTASGTDLSLRLSPEAADRLARSMQDLGATSLAVYKGSGLIAAGTLTVDASAARASVSGIAPSDLEKVTTLLRATDIMPAGPVISVVPSQTSFLSGGTITVDVFVSGVTDLRAYQVSLETLGGETGRIALDNVRIDAPRADFVFAGLQKVDAADQLGARAGSVLMSGSVDVPSSGYLGTFTLNASPDAVGTFIVRAHTQDGSSMLVDSANQHIPFTAGDGVPVQVEIPTTKGTPVRK